MEKIRATVVKRIFDMFFKEEDEGQFQCIMDKPIECMGVGLMCERGCHNYRFFKKRRMK